MNSIIEGLPEEKQKIIDILINKIKKNYSEDIAIVVCYGSYITGTSHEKSDLDFFFIPKTKKGKEMNTQFIINNIGYDFWSLSWERAERITEFKEPLVSIIGEGKLIYYSNLEDKRKYELLKQRINDLTSNKQYKPILINRAEDLLTKAKALYFDIINIDEFEEVDTKCYQILNLLTNITAFLNSTYLIKGPYNIENEIKEYKYIPEDYLRKINLITKSNKIIIKKENIKDLILSLDNKINKLNSDDRKTLSSDKLKGFYEEIISNYNKLIHACDTEDYLKAYFTAYTITEDISSILGKEYKGYNFPDLIKNIDENNFVKLKQLIIKHENKLMEIFKNKNVEINKYDNVNDFTNML